MNLYEYVVSNPTNWVDPWGLKSLHEDQFSMWDRWRYETGQIGGVFGLSAEQATRMDKYWQQYQRANALNQHPKEVAEYCKAAKQIASGCAKSAHMDVCRFILFVDENGWGAVYDKITDCVAEPFINRTLMCYQYGSGDLDQAIKDACNWRMIGADLVGLTDLCYGVDYLQGKDSIDINTGSVFRGEEQYVKGLQGLIKFSGAVAVASKAVMVCGKAAAATGAASVADDAGGQLTKQQLENARRKAVRQAWKQERDMVRRTGKGTVDWTEVQKRELLQTGKVNDYAGHHIRSVKANPHWARDPRNVEFVHKNRHLQRHRGNWRNSTSGDLIDRSIK